MRTLLNANWLFVLLQRIVVLCHNQGILFAKASKNLFAYYIRFYSASRSVTLYITSLIFLYRVTLFHFHNLFEKLIVTVHDDRNV